MNKHQKFFRDNLVELLHIGLPLKTIEDKKAWTYFLEHAYCIYSNWDTTKLDIERLTLLLKLLNQYEGNYSNTLKEKVKNRIHNLKIK